MTWILCALCGAMYLWECEAGRGTASGLTYPGYVGGVEMAQGHVWGLWLSFFLHAGIFHLAFNLYWLYRFGTALESWIGWRRYLVFWFAATGISSLSEYLVSSDVGVGASGFVYALFGMIWVGGRRYSFLREILDPQTTIVFVVWLFYCVFATGAGVLSVANAAHFGGLFYGILCAAAFIVWDDVRARWTVIALTALSFVPLAYAPWLGAWNLARGLDAIEAGRYEHALTYLDRVHIEGLETYTAQVRAQCLTALGRDTDAAQVYRDLFAQPPKTRNSGTDIFAFLHPPTANSSNDSSPELGDAYNSYAWLLATSPDAEARDADEAIKYGQMACDDSDNDSSDRLDTLACAYASAGQFDQAIATEQKAIDHETDSSVTDELKGHLKLFQSGHPYREKRAASSTATGGT